MPPMLSPSAGSDPVPRGADSCGDTYLFARMTTLVIVFLRSRTAEITPLYSTPEHRPELMFSLSWTSSWRVASGDSRTVETARSASTAGTDPVPKRRALLALDRHALEQKRRGRVPVCGGMELPHASHLCASVMVPT